MDTHTLGRSVSFKSQPILSLEHKTFVLLPQNGGTDTQEHALQMMHGRSVVPTVQPQHVSYPALTVWTMIQSVTTALLEVAADRVLDLQPPAF